MRRSPLVFFCACCAALAQGQSAVHVSIGGADIVLTAPSSDFSEVGDRLKTTVFALLTPSPIRLLAAYLPTRTLSEIGQGNPPAAFSLYAMAQVPRVAENVKCSPEAFAEVVQTVAGFDKQFDSSPVSAIREELAGRLKTIGAKPIEVGHPEMLGAIFRKTDAAGVAMLMAVKTGDISVTMAAVIGVLRVRERFLFLYLYRKYESPDTVEWARKASEAWADAILARNATP